MWKNWSAFTDRIILNRDIAMYKHAHTHVYTRADCFNNIITVKQQNPVFVFLSVTFMTHFITSLGVTLASTAVIVFLRKQICH